jgi:predicted adenine nucleotide alpha hydrolase (AANH) superfamily ATPase
MNTSSEILLHCCCGPCATASIDFLEDKGFKVKPLFFNPNIQPADEHQKRLEAFQTVCSKKNLEPLILMDESYNQQIIDRCSFCYFYRLKKASEMAVELGFNAFTTTLLISPYQKHNLLKQTGEGFGNFIYFDLRSQYISSQRQAKDFGIYMQKYCGCLCSRDESVWLAKRKSESKRIKSGPASDWTPDWLKQSD